MFHASDAANIWDIDGRNNLRKTLSRYAAAGLIFRLHKGFYSTKLLKDLDPRLVGLKALHAPAYISCESVLFEKGIINQKPLETTMVSGVSRRFSVGDIRFRSRRLADEFLFNDAGIERANGVHVATAERAIADMLYFNPRAYFDAHSSKLVDWKKVKAVAREVGYDIIVPS